MWTSDMDKTPGDHSDADGAQADENPVAPEEQIDERQQMLDAMEEHYEFPGDYKMVVIAKVGEGFRARLIEFLDAHLEEGEYRIRERKSRKGNFVSYHVNIHVVSAEIALERKHSISRIEGVHLLL